MRLAKELDISPLTAAVLIQRGYESLADARRFLNPSLKDLTSPEELLQLDQAVDRIISAMTTKEGIGIYGDYDADGITATALVVNFFNELGFPASYYLPHRLRHGYGIHCEIIDSMAADGVNLVISVDCGITSNQEIAYASEKGIDFIVTDHHQAAGELPPAAGVVNPQQPGSGEHFRELSGVGVAFFLLLGLRRRLREEGWFHERPEPDLKTYLPLVALGTVADVSPLIADNRILVSFGLRELALSNQTGLMGLKDAVGLKKNKIRVWNLAFQIVPRINAAGRLGEASRAVRLLITRDPKEASRLINILESENSRRKVVEAKIMRQAEAMLAGSDALEEEKGILLAGEGWHTGVIGIVAGRLASNWSRPVIVIAIENGIGQASARSIPGFDIFSCFQAGAEYLISFGGHPAAAGLRIRERDIPAFSRFFEAYSEKVMALNDLRETLRIDVVAHVDDLSLGQAAELSQLEPFGHGNREPVLAISDVEVVSADIVGKGHLKLSGRKDGRTLSLWGFGMGEYLPLLTNRVDLAFHMRVSNYYDVPTLELRMRDIKPSSQ